MCGRLNIMDMPAIDAFLKQLGILSHQLNLDECRYNVAPQSLVPAIGVEGKNVVGEYMWGHHLLIRGQQKLVINTRSENTHTSIAWREALNHRGAVVLCNGFYEWQRNAHNKQAYYIYREGPMALAALWFDEVSPNLTLLTEASHCNFGEIHHRQPLLLNENEVYDWLDDSDYRTKIIHNRQRPTLYWHPVSNRVNSTQYNEPECINNINASTTSKVSSDDESTSEQLTLPGFHVWK